MGFQEICEDVVRDTEGALCCLLIDLRTAIPLSAAYRAGARLDDSEIRMVLRTSEETFRGKILTQFVRSLPTGRTLPAGFVEEVQVTTAYTYQFMAVLPGWEDGLVVLITDKTLSLGLAWMAVHQVQDQFEESLQGGGPEIPSGQAASATADVQPRGSPTADRPAPGSDGSRAISAAPAPIMPERPSTPVRASTPATDPAAKATPAEQPVRNPRLAKEAKEAKEREVRTSDPAVATPESDSPPEPERRVVSGPRARMFRDRKDR